MRYLIFPSYQQTIGYTIARFYSYVDNLRGPAFMSQNGR